MSPSRRVIGCPQITCYFLYLFSLFTSLTATVFFLHCIANMPTSMFILLSLLSYVHTIFVSHLLCCPHSFLLVHLSLRGKCLKMCSLTSLVPHWLLWEEIWRGACSQLEMVVLWEGWWINLLVDEMAELLSPRQLGYACVCGDVEVAVHAARKFLQNLADEHMVHYSFSCPSICHCDRLKSAFCVINLDDVRFWIWPWATTIQRSFVKMHQSKVPSFVLFLEPK